ncbi:hypothetical protein ACUY3K_05910 [Corynebacterium uberis]|uniref:hypothetical protein n=1 Tax=Corynebacterium TaxID=1716 RepID=UPI001D09BBCD|nr:MULTISPECIES: hypothetical protein [Corynebacterium]MCZ9308229.1 hypothetical protein [Corynebacterium sp. c6VSa_13]UDL73909.1 hypothetical protein LH391_01380 [Corynebacterium uberis]UDL75208.1 hypothetical protein LH393_08035 [Corynebacterium uberis]UDL77419.1 hypothetical protein LH394_08015 [Corynebacterium uberis]UDL79704.1 hypothetical protein LH392_08440 [Corynebacterium uberis]
MSSPITATHPRPDTTDLPTGPWAPPGARMAVLCISGLPNGARRDVESLMLDYLDEQCQWVLPGADPLEASWCTRWRREGRETVGCRQIICAPSEQLARFAQALREGPGARAQTASLNAPTPPDDRHWWPDPQAGWAG